MSNEPVLIAGAGLGGLLLGHGLKRRGIPFHIYERDFSLSSRTQGYRLRIRESGVKVLERMLLPEVFERVQDTAAENGVPGAIRDAETGEAKETIKAAMMRAMPQGPPQPPERTLHVDRTILRTVLYDGLEQCTSFDKGVVSFQSTSEEVTVQLTDGSSATGSLLVGADGKQSAVARQLLGEQFSQVDLGLQMYFAKTPLNEITEQDIGEDLTNGFHITMENYGGSGRCIITEVARFKHEDEPKMDDYLWTLICGTDEQFGTDQQPSGEEAKQLIIATTSNFHPSYRALFANMDSSQLTSGRMMTSDPRGVTPWKSNRRVTALGDAIHLMPPTGGFGASTTFEDVEGLCDVLGETWASGDWGERLAEWEKEMRRRGISMVKQALSRLKLFRLDQPARGLGLLESV